MYQTVSVKPCEHCSLCRLHEGQLAYDANLRTQRGDKSPLQSIEYKGELVFDAENSVVFENWAKATTKPPAESAETPAIPAAP